MRYTVSSRGRPIGVTDLAFPHLGGPFRFGWFHPNTEGERLMPVIASVIPAVRAYLHLDVLGEDGLPIVPPRSGATRRADLVEALHHAGSLDLALHREDGTLVPTEDITMQDTEQLLALAEWDDARLGAQAPWGDEEPDEELDAEIERAVQHDLEILLANEALHRAEARQADRQPPALPRYQIHVVLVDDDAIP